MTGFKHHLVALFCCLLVSAVVKSADGSKIATDSEQLPKDKIPERGDAVASKPQGMMAAVRPTSQMPDVSSTEASEEENSHTEEKLSERGATERKAAVYRPGYGQYAGYYFPYQNHKPGPQQKKPIVVPQKGKGAIVIPGKGKGVVAKGVIYVPGAGKKGGIPIAKGKGKGKGTGKGKGKGNIATAPPTSITVPPEPTEPPSPTLRPTTSMPVNPTISPGPTKSSPPTQLPSVVPTPRPTFGPTTLFPTPSPTKRPTPPTVRPSDPPSLSPTVSKSPTTTPTTPRPTRSPAPTTTPNPTDPPTDMPTRGCRPADSSISKGKGKGKGVPPPIPTGKKGSVVAKGKGTEAKGKGAIGNVYYYYGGGKRDRDRGLQSSNFQDLNGGLIDYGKIGAGGRTSSKGYDPDYWKLPICPPSPSPTREDQRAKQKNNKVIYPSPPRYNAPPPRTESTTNSFYSQWFRNNGKRD